MNKVLTFAAILSLSACSVIPLEEISDFDDRVRLYERYESVENCTFIDEIVGTEGLSLIHISEPTRPY